MILQNDFKTIYIPPEQDNVQVSNNPMNNNPVNNDMNNSTQRTSVMISSSEKKIPPAPTTQSVI